MKELEMKYEELGGFEYANVLEKIYNTPASNNLVASQIHKRVTEIKKARDKVTTDYKKDIMEKYAARDEKGNIVQEEGQPGAYKVNPEKLEEFKKAQEDFGKRTVKIKCLPFTFEMLQDVKLTPKEVGLLGAFLTEETENNMDIQAKLLKMKNVAENRIDA